MWRTRTSKSDDTFEVGQHGHVRACSGESAILVQKASGCTPNAVSRAAGTVRHHTEPLSVVIMMIVWFISSFFLQKLKNPDFKQETLGPGP